MDDEKSTKAAIEEQQATDEGDLSVTTKELDQAENTLAKTTSGCLQTAADHEATVAARNEELKVIAEAKKILQETTAGAVSQSYSLLQVRLRTRDDLLKSEVVAA